MSDNTDISEVELRAFHQVVSEIGPKLNDFRSTADEKRRYELLQSVQASFRAKIDKASNVLSVIPELFCFSGDLYTGLLMLDVAKKHWESVGKERIQKVLRTTTSGYNRILAYIQKITPDTNEWKDEIQNQALSLELAREKALVLLSWLDKDDIETLRLEAEFEWSINHNYPQAVIIYRRIIDNPASQGEDYAKLTDYLMLLWDTKGAADAHELWYLRTKDEKHFYCALRFMIPGYWEDIAREFYNNYIKKVSYVPFSLLRGKIENDKELPDLNWVGALFFIWNDIEATAVEYLNNSSPYIQKRIQELEEKFLWARKGTAKRMEVAWYYFKLLEFLEYQIYYLHDFTNLTTYLSLVWEQLWTTEWREQLRQYFNHNSLRALWEILDIESSDWVDKMSSKKSKHDTEHKNDTDFEHLGSWVAADSASEKTESELSSPVTVMWVHSHIYARYSYLQLHVAMHNPPQMGAVDLWQDTSTEHVSPENELDLISAQFGKFFPETMSSVEAALFKRKVSLERLAMEHMGPITQREYNSLIEDIDKKHGITFRRMLQYYARSWPYIGDTFPAICMESNIFILFFICERLISWNEELFKWTLDEILSNFNIRDVEDHDVTLIEVLLFRGKFEIVIELICNTQQGLELPDIKSVISRMILELWLDSEIVQKLLQALDDCVRENYNADNYQDFLIKSEEDISVDLSGTEPESDEYLALQDHLATIQCTLWMLLAKTHPDDSENYITKAQSLDNFEAFFYRVETDLGAPNIDKENLLESLFLYLEEISFPLRARYYGLMIRVATQLWDTDSIQKCLQMAYAEGVNIADYMIMSLEFHPEFRSIAYQHLITTGDEIYLTPETHRKFQDVLNSDIASPTVPMNLRIQASILKNAFCTHPEYGNVPSIVEHIHTLESIVTSSDIKEVQTELLDALSMLHSEFELLHYPQEMQLPATLQFHCLTIWSEIEKTMTYYPIDSPEFRYLIKKFLTFIDCVMAIYIKIPHMNQAFHVQQKNDVILFSVPVLSYWSMERNRIGLLDSTREDDLHTAIFDKTHDIDPKNIDFHPPQPTIH